MFIDGYYGHTFAISGTGAAFLSTSTLMQDGRPSQVTRCRWLSTAPNTANFVRITINLTDPDAGTIKIGGVGVFGITNLPLGLKVVFNGDTGNPVTLAKCPTGGLMAVYIPSAVITASSITVDFYNDVSGVATVLANATFEIGELIAGQRWYPKDGVQADWKLKPVDPSVIRDSSDNQPNKLIKVGYRIGTLNSSWLDWNETYGTPVVNPFNLQDFNFRMAKCTRALIIPRWRTTLGSVTPDKPSIVATAVIGMLTQMGDIENQGGVYFRQQWTYREFSHG